jgi:hypothetical protein
MKSSNKHPLTRLANKEYSNSIMSISASLGSHGKYPGPVSSNSYSITAGVSIGFLAAAATTTNQPSLLVLSKLV